MNKRDRPQKSKKRVNVDHFITQLHQKKSGGVGAHKSKKTYTRKNKHKRGY